VVAFGFARFTPTRTMKSLLAALCCAALVIASPRMLEAQAPSELERAKELFRQGNELRKAGDCQRALELFVQSRKLVPSVPNILNAAYCLNVLGRFDEALEHYELLLTKFKAELRPEELELIAPAMARLRDQVGSLDVRVNVADAKLIVDGRARGKLPLIAPIRVLPGSHEVVVSREGYESFQSRFDVGAGKLHTVRAALKPLKLAGRLRVDEPRGAELIVDGAPVGKLPWEGTLAPGEHWIAAHKGELGSAPTRVIVVTGQTMLGTLSLRVLGPELSIAVDPPSAEILLSGVALGRGRWQGRLPRGRHNLQARAEGYFAGERSVEVTATEPRSVSLKLKIDESHPRWGAKRGAFFVDGVLGFGAAPGLGTGAEASCEEGADCASNGVALGFLGAARGGYELPSRLSIEILVGYLYLQKSLERRFAAIGSVPAVFDLEDRLRVAGPLLGAGVGYRLPLSEQFSLHAALFGGAILVGARDQIEASATAAGQTTSASVAGSGRTTRSANLLVMPELGLGLRLSRVRLGLGVLVPILLLQGPDNEHGETSIDQSQQCAANNVFCTQALPFSERERAHGRLLAIVPAISAGYSF
jgi:hypothetical protein